MNIIRKMEYKGSTIQVMHHENIFMYFFYFDGELYMQHAWVEAELWRRILGRFGLFPYTQQQLDELEQAMLQGAMDSLDHLNKLSPKKRKAKKKLVADHDKMIAKKREEERTKDLIQKVAPATDGE